MKLESLNDFAPFWVHRSAKTGQIHPKGPKVRCRRAGPEREILNCHLSSPPGLELLCTAQMGKTGTSTSLLDALRRVKTYFEIADFAEP